METQVEANKLIGKTISKIDATCVNVWVFHFTDGTFQNIGTEVNGFNKIPYLELWDEMCEE